jgi:small subunit ribosomal protein S15
MSEYFNARKPGIIAKFKRSEKDVGSPEVQIALLSARIDHLTAHCSARPNDAHSRMGMFQLVSTRKRLLKYLKGESPERYKQTISALDLRR